MTPHPDMEKALALLAAATAGNVEGAEQLESLLRRLPPVGNQLDIENIAEEIEDLGRSDLRTARSLCQHIIEHLLKLEYSGLEEPADHWRDEIV